MRPMRAVTASTPGVTAIWVYRVRVMNCWQVETALGGGMSCGNAWRVGEACERWRNRWRVGAWCACVPLVCLNQRHNHRAQAAIQTRKQQPKRNTQKKRTFPSRARPTAASAARAAPAAPPATPPPRRPPPAAPPWRPGPSPLAWGLVVRPRPRGTVPPATRRRRRRAAAGRTAPPQLPFGPWPHRKCQRARMGCWSSGAHRCRKGRAGRRRRCCRCGCCWRRRCCCRGARTRFLLLGPRLLIRGRWRLSCFSERQGVWCGVV